MQCCKFADIVAALQWVKEILELKLTGQKNTRSFDRVFLF